jgi:hypothetical protein
VFLYEAKKRDKGLHTLSFIPYPYTIPCNNIRCKLFFLQVEAFAEALHTTSGVENTLLPGEEWVTLRADIDLEYRADAKRLETVPTGTADCGLSVIWVNSLFHDLLTPRYLQ